MPWKHRLGVGGAERVAEGLRVAPRRRDRPRQPVRLPRGTGSPGLSRRRQRLRGVRGSRGRAVWALVKKEDRV